MEQFIFNDNYSVEEIEEDINIICDEYRRLEEILCSKLITEDDTKRYEEVLVAIGAAENALELQVPKKPLEQNIDDLFKTGTCPNCKGERDLAFDTVAEFMNYCPACGQRLDWS